MQFAVKKTKVNFSKTTKLHEPLRRVQFTVWKKLTSAYLHQITREIRLSLVNNLHEKSITEVLDRM